jgi:hypothetical protein
MMSVVPHFLACDQWRESSLPSSVIASTSAGVKGSIGVEAAAIDLCASCAGGGAWLASVCVWLIVFSEGGIDVAMVKNHCQYTASRSNSTGVKMRD